MVQDARKGVQFESLPPVLQLHLKRFTYDLDRDMNVKACSPFVQSASGIHVKRLSCVPRACTAQYTC